MQIHPETVQLSCLLDKTKQTVPSLYGNKNIHNVADIKHHSTVVSVPALCLGSAGSHSRLRGP